MPYKDPAKRREISRRWKDRNQQHIRDYNRRRPKRKRKHSESDRARLRRWRAANAEKCREQGRWYHRRWAKSNPEKVREGKRKRRAREKNAISNFHPWMEKYYRYAQQDRCFYCGRDISQAYHLEHMTPFKRGGLHSWDNTCLACPSCNLRKGIKTAEEFLS